MSHASTIDWLRAIPFVSADPATMGELESNLRAERVEALLIEQSRPAGTASVLPLRANRRG